MIVHHLKVSWRNIKRYKIFSGLNIASLTLGIVFTLLIGLWVHDEWSYNRFHQHLDDLFFVRTNAVWDGLKTFSTTPGPLRDAIVKEVPEVKAATRMSGGNDHLLSMGKDSRKLHGLYVDPDFLLMFSFPTIAGDVRTALAAPTQIVLTKSVSDRFFGSQDPIGQEITIDQEMTCTVGAVLEDVPNHSEIQFDWLRPWQVFEKERAWSTTWGNVSFATYLQLRPEASIDEVNRKIAHIGNAEEHALEFFGQPMQDRYLYGKYEAGRQAGGRIEYVRLFSIIAIFLLVIACINFMNMSSARSSTRAKEIGIRKSVGASRNALVRQFMGEAILVSLISMVLAILITQGALSWFNQMFEKEIEIPYGNPLFYASAGVLVLVTGLLAGSYPAFFLSGLRPNAVLKGEVLKNSDRTILLRKGLVIFQFAISALLIIATLVINNQIHFIKHKNLGLDRQHLFYTYISPDQAQIFRERVSSSPAIASMTITGDNPMNLDGSSGDLVWPGKDPDEMVLVAPLQVGNDFVKTMALELIAGRDFSSEFGSDSTNYILNENAVKAIGIEDPIGAEIEFWNGKGKIIGVLKDYHLESLHVPIRPLVLTYVPDNWIAWIRPAFGRTSEAIAHVQKVTKEMNPKYPFEYTFADEAFEKQYHNETLTASIANIFGCIAIIISCLGLLGLAIYSAERRRREIGIRKILGATISNIIQLISREFLILVVLALIIAMPIGWYMMQKWLDQFAYNIHFEWWMFVLTSLIAIAIAMLTVGVQGLRSALADPIESIRSE